MAQNHFLQRIHNEHFPFQHHQHLRRKRKSLVRELPELVAAISSKLDLRDLKEVTNLAYNYVLSGFQGDNPIILKLGRDQEAVTREAFTISRIAVHVE